jgi:hypothetical protein
MVAGAIMAGDGRLSASAGCGRGDNHRVVRLVWGVRAGREDAWETSKDALQAPGTAAIAGSVLLAGWYAGRSCLLIGSRREWGEAGGTGITA